jgi:antitoxin component YwqK of YwqJK toxin-antitoxin module
MYARVRNMALLALLLVSVNYRANGQNEVADNGFVQIFYPNGQVSSEGTMVDGKPDGYWRTYYVTGVIKSEGKRTNFLLDSIWNFYNQAGELTQEISYQLGEKSGYSNSYSYNNPEKPGQATLISKELYVRGKKEGASYYYHPTGELKLIVFYREGMKQGLSREFTRDSTLITVVQYKDNYVVDRERVNRTDNQGNKQGTFREYYENGNIKKEENYLDNQLHGYYREFDGNGELLVAIRYERGQIMEEIDEDMRELLDMKSTYDEQGRLIFTGGYKEGIPVGIHRFFDTAGVVENAYFYNERGQKLSEGIIDEQGENLGNWKDFYPTGELRATGTYAEQSAIRNLDLLFPFRRSGTKRKILTAEGTREAGIGTIPTAMYGGKRVISMAGKTECLWSTMKREIYLPKETTSMGKGKESGSTRWEIMKSEESYVIGLREGIWKYFYQGWNP